MHVTMVDTASAMERLLNADAPQRGELLRQMWAPMADLYRFAPDVDLTAVHRGSFGFDATSGDAQLRDGLTRLIEQDAWNRIANALQVGATALRAADPNATIPDLTVLLILGDPNNRHFMDEIQGLSAFGGISGYIVLTLWPSPLVIERLEAIAVHELHHNVRYSPGGVVWDPQTVTVGEQIVAEGLADVFAAELYGDRGLTHFVAERTRTDDAVLAKVTTGLGVTGMHNFTAWVHGDASAQLFGCEPVGLPTGAGYAAGVRLVRRYLDATGSTAAANTRTPAKVILGASAVRS